MNRLSMTRPRGFRFVCALLWFSAAAARASSIVSSMPLNYVPGTPFFVTNAVSPDSDVFVYAAEDTVPAGWTVSAVSDGGTFDSATGAVQWGPFFDGLPRPLNYQVTPPANSTSTVVFAGTGVFDLSEQVSVTGQRTIAVASGSLNAIVCQMPATFVPGMAFLVTNAVSLAAGVAVYAVQDTLPSGWAATYISDQGTFSQPNRTVRWGPFFDGVARNLFYTAVPPSNLVAGVAFAGQGNFGGTEIPITGQRLLQPIVAPPGAVVSFLPPQFTPGQWFTVTNSVTPGSNDLLFAVQDQPPAGWQVTNINAGGIFDTQNNVVRWGPSFNAGPMLLTCQVLPPTSASGSAHFTGSASFDGTTVPIGGERTSQAIPVVFGSAVSLLPGSYSPGVTFTVTNIVTPAANIAAFAVEDSPPAGWVVSTVSEEGTFDPGTQSVQWGPFFDALPRILTYQVTPGLIASGDASFSGQAQFDAATIPITGQRQLTRNIAFAGSVVRTIPANFYDGTAFIIADLATPAGNISAYAVQDTIPSGWIATNISDHGTFDALANLVQWGPFFDHVPRQLNYQAIPPWSAAGVAVFSGQAVFDSTSISITGQLQSVLAPGPAPQALIQINNPTRLNDGPFQFDFTNATGLAVNVLASTNLALPLSNWDLLSAPLPLGGGVYRVTDPAAANLPRRFYRLH